jgi:hypothetical protein
MVVCSSGPTKVVAGMLVVLIAFFGAACGSYGSGGNSAEQIIEGPTAQTSDLAIKSVKLMRDDGKGNSGEEVKSFRPADRKQHFQVELTATKMGSLEAKWVFTALDTTAGKNIKIFESKVTGLVGNIISGSVRLPRDWPSGSYKADLYLNDKLIKTIEYVVSRPVSELSVISVKLRRDDGGGNPGEEVKVFRPSDHKQHFEAEVDGFFVGEAKVKWVFTALDTTAGKNKQILEAEFDATDFKGNTLTSFCELPRDWPPGTYKGDIYINGKLVKTFEYIVLN